jgi:hypothetical protein
MDTAMATSLDKEYEYYKSHEAELRLRYFGRCIVIKGSEVIGDYDDKTKAIAEAIAQGNKPGTFLVQFVAPDEDAQVAMFHSRVFVR